MPGHLLRTFRPDDAPVIHGLHVRHAAADEADPHSTMEPLLDPEEVRRRMQAADWAAVAVDASGSAIGWGSLRSWTEVDGTRVYLTDGYVAPPARRQGLRSHGPRVGGTTVLHAADRGPATRLAQPIATRPLPGRDRRRTRGGVRCREPHARVHRD